MNKQEAIEAIKKQSTQAYDDFAIMRDTAIHIINQIDEPEKVVIPKFVAEWIERQKESFSDASAIDMYDNLTIDNNGGHYHEVWLWVIAHHHDFIKAWHDGYTVEKEKLYTVEIPDPHGPYEIRYLLRNSAGNICIGVANYKDIFLDAKTHLTESEIKKNFEWAWQWAKEVE